MAITFFIPVVAGVILLVALLAFISMRKGD